MRRDELEHLIRASCQIVGQDQVLVVGSQSVLGTYSEYELPEESTFSEEADVIPLYDDAEGSAADQIDGAIGEMSRFHQTHGIYAQGVSRRTALLSTGWEGRLVPIRNENTRYFTGWCLDVHDLCASKLLANRDKDRDFVRALIVEDLVLVETIRERVAATETDEAKKAIALTWLSDFAVEQPNYRAPDVTVDIEGWPEHPAAVFAAQDAAAARETARAKAWGNAGLHRSSGPGHDGPGHSPTVGF